MHNRILKGALLGLALAGMSMSAQAHRGWLLPSTAMVEAKEPWVTLDGAISEGLFEFHHVPLRLDNLTITGPDGVTTKAEGAVLGKFRSTIDIPLPKNGTYRLAIVSNNVMGSYKLGGEVKRFRGVEGTPGAQVPAGDYKLVVEAAREAGGRELVKVPFTWTGKGKVAANATGKEELGAVALELQ